MFTLYLTTPDTNLSFKKGKFVVEKPDTEVKKYPLRKIDKVIVTSRISMDSYSIQKLLSEEIAVYFLAMSGRYQGKLQSVYKPNLPLRIAQYKFTLLGDISKKLKITKQLVKGKIKNSYRLMLRWARSRDINTKTIKNEYKNANSILNQSEEYKELRGVEGLFAAFYFRMYRKFLRTKFGFKSRNRYPPRDPINSLLSFGYTLLAQDITAVLEQKGLDPYFGFYHKPHYNNPTLTLDLIEDLRSVVVDSMVLDLVNHSSVSSDDFEKRGRGIFIKKKLLRKFLKKYEGIKKKKYELNGEELSYYQIFLKKAQNYKEIVNYETEEIFTFTIR